jgi:hypothetical protein
MSPEQELRVHRAWIGLLQPVGLVVSPPALQAAQAFPDTNILKEQQSLLALIAPPPKEGEKKPAPGPLRPLAFEAFATKVLGWKPSRLAGGNGGPAIPDSLERVLPEFGETLRPSFAVAAVGADEGGWQMLIQELADGIPLDELPREDTHRWHASPQVRFERLLRETAVPIGVLSNGRSLRLVYAPRGESSGHITWPVHRLTTALDREMLSALCMLLGSARLFALPKEQRLPHILRESRKYQNVVSTKLAGQVLEALNELLRGFQAANETTRGALLDDTVRADPEHVYGGLLAVLLRLVFVLYAEERGMLPSSAIWVRHYSLIGLFEKLRVDHGRFPDTMDQRYGAWSRLIVLFRMVHDGAARGELRLPPRYGHLFDPDGWGFLEGRPLGVRRVMGGAVEVPRVPDGVVFRVLEKLLRLDGDRLSYRALDVEQIGSVYENMMGFRLERATERVVGVGKAHVVVGLESLLAKRGAEREKFLKETADVELTGKAAEALRTAITVDDLVAALSKRLSPLTPRVIPAGGLYLQPGDERRRSGSHYTPRELTEPIVRTTLRPILEDLGPRPTPAQILALKVCDPAMGSGAFLVETCRQLAEQLVKAWDLHGRPGDLAPHEDVLLYAQRQVAQHCLYGVDKNPFAVDLGKLSLWLATLAKDHAFTFLDHALRHGDSLVGLSREQIASFHWAPEKQVPIIRAVVDRAIGEAMALRAQIPALANSDDVDEKRRLLRDADEALAKVRTVGDAVVACFFSEEKAKAREAARATWEAKTLEWLVGGARSSEIAGFVAALREGERPVPCFHWELEFPEVFARGGFDAMVGNPPFLGGTRISAQMGMQHFGWLTMRFPGAGHHCDLVAYFFRCAFSLIGSGGTFGLLATKTISQGDTRKGGLAWISSHQGTIYEARKRFRWPGTAAVMVSAVHVAKRAVPAPLQLDRRPVDHITAYLFHRGGSEDPARIEGRNDLFSIGCKIYGQGFLFADDEPKASPVSAMRSLLASHPSSGERIFPYLGGVELNQSPTHASYRWVIDVNQFEEAEIRARWPALMAVVEERVKPERMQLGDNPNNVPLRRRWWAYHAHRPDLYRRLSALSRALVCTQTSKHRAFVFYSTGVIFDQKLVVIALDDWASFAILQSRIHEEWSLFFGASLEDRPVYTPSDCFETFVFPPSAHCGSVADVGRSCYEFRASLLVSRNEGLTAVYNRFHDPDETDSDILQLRALHDAMDRAVLDAYGWTDLQPTCEFLLDYEEDEDEDATPARRKKKPWRYRWPDAFRDEVLARLLELNAQRAKEEALAAAAAAAEKPKARAGTKTKKAPPSAQGGLFGEESD